MRPFLCSILKCTACGSVRPQKLNPVDVVKVAPPKCVPRIEDYRREEQYLLDLVDTLSKIGSEIISISEKDARAFLDSTEEEGGAVNKIVEALYGVDVISGSVACSDCGVMKNIKDGILFCEDS